MATDRTFLIVVEGKSLAATASIHKRIVAHAPFTIYSIAVIPGVVTSVTEALVQVKLSRPKAALIDNVLVAANTATVMDTLTVPVATAAFQEVSKRLANAAGDERPVSVKIGDTIDIAVSQAATGGTASTLILVCSLDG